MIHSPFRSRPIPAVRFGKTMASSSSNSNKRRASEPPVAFSNNDAAAVSKSTSGIKKARHSLAVSAPNSSKSKDRTNAASIFITKSPYEKDYCAEKDEYLFDNVKSIFLSLGELEQYNEIYQTNVKHGFMRLEPYGSKPTPDFYRNALKAYQVLQETDTVWDEGWTAPAVFGLNITKKGFPDYLLLLMIRPELIALATSEQLTEIFSLRNTFSAKNVLKIFKEALVKLDPSKQFPLLHRAPGKAVRTMATRKMVLFIDRVYLAMELCGFASLDDVDDIQPTVSSTAAVNADGELPLPVKKHHNLPQKVRECFRLLQASALSNCTPRASSTIGTEPAAPAVATTMTATMQKAPSSVHKGLSRPSSSDEDDSMDGDESDIKVDRTSSVAVADTIKSRMAGNNTSVAKTADMSNTMTMKSIVDFLQAKEERYKTMEQKQQQLDLQCLEQKRLIQHQKTTVQQYRAKLQEYKTENQKLRSQLVQVQTQESDELIALQKRLATLQRENKTLCEEKKELKQYVSNL